MSGKIPDQGGSERAQFALQGDTAPDAEAARDEIK